MIPLPFGITLLAIVAIVILLGLAERVLNRMKLDNKTAIALLLLLAVAHFLPAISLTGRMGFNLGVLIPFGVVVYLLATTSSMERGRALLVSIGTAGLLWFSDQVMPIEPGAVWYDIDPIYIGGVFAGLLAYLVGRSRRSAFIGAVLGILIVDIIAVFQITAAEQPEKIIIGGGGMFDSLIISPILAVGIAEFIGEIRERVHRGPAVVGSNEEGNGDD